MQRTLSPAPLALALALAMLLTACGPASDPSEAAGPAAAPPESAPAPQDDGTQDDGTQDDSTRAEVTGDAGLLQSTVPTGDVLAVREVARRPHDPTAFTQGLEFHEGRLFESRGLYADDEPVTLTEIDPTDGTAIREAPRDPADGDHFAEGLTVVGDRIIQLTWQSNIAFVYDRDTFQRTDEFTYEGEGWGLCDEPDRLVMSNGTPTLTFRDLETFEVLGTVTVTHEGQPVDELNELECVDGLVWANVWRTSTIMVIQPDTGEVVSVVDASAIADRNGRFVDDPDTDVLNGIAYDPMTGTWLLTGKWWPWMVEVEFDCVEGCAPSVTPSHYIRPRPPAHTAP